MRVFVDSDVIISSLLSEKGAAFILMNTPDITRIITTISLRELHIVCRRLNISERALDTLIQKKFAVLPLRKKTKDYHVYVTDPNDAHIVAGTVLGKAAYLVSYNIKHFKMDKIKDELGLLLMTPAIFLQFLRSH